MLLPFSQAIPATLKWHPQTYSWTTKVQPFLTQQTPMKHRQACSRLVLALPFLLATAAPAMADSQPMRMNSNITEQQVLAAQQGWCNGLLAISKAYATGGYASAQAKIGRAHV